MLMSKEEFVATIQRLARRERERKELAALEKKRRQDYILTDYIMDTARRMKWDRRYRRRRKNRKLSDEN